MANLERLYTVRWAGYSGPQPRRRTRELGGQQRVEDLPQRWRANGARDVVREVGAQTFEWQLEVNERRSQLHGGVAAPPRVADLST